MRPQSRGGTSSARALSSIESEIDENEAINRGRASNHSSRSGDFLDHEPTFDSGGSSASSESDLGPEKPSRSPVSVVWQNLSVESGGGLFSKEKTALLKNVSGFAEPRSVLAVVGPFRSGKSALLNLIGSRLKRSVTISGSMTINGKGLRDTWVRPTYVSSKDEALANVTVEQALVYTALLQMPDTGNGELEDEVRRICQRLGLMGDLNRSTNSLDFGTKRRVTVACQLICCSSLVILEDVLLGIQEGDALAIMRAVHDLTKEGCTAVLSVGQPTTDICSFFSRAYILANGEVVYFGDSGSQAMDLLLAAGMPCPPLYSPVEQYMRLVDNTFEVYLQANAGGTDMGDDWNARFSSMMFKVLQGAYQNSPIAEANNQQAKRLGGSIYEPFQDETTISAGKQCFVLCRRLVTQGLQGLPLYLGRIIFAVLISLVYGGTYWKLDNTFLGAQQRTTVLFIAAAVLPATAIGTLPFYRNASNVFLRENKRCRLGIPTYFIALFTLTLPHLAVAAAFSAIVFIPMTDLNNTGSAWGYFILNATMAQMCADSIMLVVATAMPAIIAYQVALAILMVQALASGFFPGSNRGFNLPVSAVSSTSWSYRGLLANEFKYRGSFLWYCPGSIVPAVYQAQTIACSLDGEGTFAILAQDIAMKTDSRWIPIYVLLGVYAFWTLLFLALLKLRSLTGKASPSDAVDVEMVYNPLHSQPNPLHSNRSVDAAELPGGSPKDGLYGTNNNDHHLADSPV